MLSMKPLKSAKGAHEYYTKAIQYYQSDATSTQWLGSGRDYFKLDGPIDAQQFLRLLEGRLPNGQKLQNPQGEHRPGFDMTFSAPKSVSVLVGLGAAPQLIKMHDEAVKYAIASIEQEFAEARVVKQGEVAYENTGNLLIASFRQPSSRANDPALHTHCVTLNITFLNGKARSLASDKSREEGVVEQIQNHQRYCGLLYRHHLANSLKEAGFKLRMSGDGLFEIEGMPEAVLTEFSRRREDIERLMEEKGWTGAKGAAIASEISRAGKEEHNPAILQADWEQRAKALQFDAKAFMAHREEYPSKLTAFLNGFKNIPAPSKTCVQIAIETLSQRTSVFTERALLTDALKHSLTADKAIPRDNIEAAIQEAKANKMLYVANCTDSKETILTTPWALNLEAETIARIDENKGAVHPIATQAEVESFQKSLPLNASQKEAMTALMTSKDRFSAIQGYAGVAKTSMLQHAKTLMEEKGFQLRGIAVASTAANELEKKSQIRTDVFPMVYQALKDARRHSLSKSIFIVDEASQLSSPQGHELMKQIERVGARLILVGDKAQLPSVQMGRLFGLIQDYGIETVVMDDIVRQKNPRLKEAVIHATKGEVKAAIEKLEVQELSIHEERIQWIANHWLSLDKNKRHETLLFAPTHHDRIAITKILRDGLKAENTLTGSNISQTTLHHKVLEPIQQRFVAYYQKGDVIRFNQAFPKHRIEQDQYYSVDTILPKHRKDNVLPLINPQGKTLQFKLKSLPHYKTQTAAFERVLEIYTEKKLELQIGDHLMWTRNFKGSGIRNGDAITLAAINDKTYTLITKDGEIITLDKEHPALKHLDHGYVLTNYKVQGKDAPYGIGLMESYHRFGATLKNFYVQISRGIHGMTLVTDDKALLIEALLRHKDEKEAAMDKISSYQLQDHTHEFKPQISLQKVIEKKTAFEQVRQQPIEELVFTKTFEKYHKELER